MEKFPKNEEEKLKAFYTEIAELKKQEETEGKTAHFKDCFPYNLEEEDKKIYEKLISNRLTVEELREYKNKLEELGNKSRIIFSEYISSVLQNKLFEKRPKKDK